MSATDKIKAAIWEADRQLDWREVRNRLAHEYPDQPEVRFAALMAAIDAARSLAALFQDWRSRLGPAGLT